MREGEGAAAVGGIMRAPRARKRRGSSTPPQSEDEWGTGEGSGEGSGDAMVDPSGRAVEDPEHQAAEVGTELGEGPFS